MNITLIKQKGCIALVEYGASDGAPERVWIPSSELDGIKVKKDVVRYGVKYGLPWRELLSDSVIAPNLTAAINFEHILRANGIWTLSDLTNSSDMTHGLIRKVTASIVANLIKSATQYNAER